MNHMLRIIYFVTKCYLKLILTTFRYKLRLTKSISMLRNWNNLCKILIVYFSFLCLSRSVVTKNINSKKVANIAKLKYPILCIQSVAFSFTLLNFQRFLTRTHPFRHPFLKLTKNRA